MLKPERGNTRLCYHFLFLGYKDYIAARHLLINGFYFQGITLVCTTIEKYFKAALAIKGKKKQLHLDRLDEFYKILRNNDVNIEDKVDKPFMELLSNVYKLRYFDKIEYGNGVSYGFFVNQILCEMDYLVNLIENSLEIKTNKNDVILSEYKQDLKNGNPKICTRNYLTENIDKKEFMEKGSPVFIIRILDDGNIMEIESNKDLFTKYTDKICLVSMSDIKN